MNGDEHIEMLAAEYVLGTLDDEARRAVADRRERDPALDQAISAWESDLSPWLDDYANVSPPHDLRDEILQRISEKRSAAERSSKGSDAGRLRTQLAWWRTAALAGYGLAAILAAVILTRPPSPSPTARFVAVFQSNDEQPAFVMSVDLETREIVIRPVTAKPVQGKTYQLWIASDRLGGEPKSLGLLDDASRPIRKELQYPADLLQEATFGISLEPEGGSPTGRPTGKALHGRLIPSDI